MTTTIAFLSDVHGDVHALRDALGQLERLRVDRIVCLGDVVDYGVFPDETIALLAEKAIPTVRGNHDRWCLANGSFGANARDLTAESRRFLKATTPSWSATVDGTRVVAHHAWPDGDMYGVLPDAEASELVRGLDQASADVLVVGHTHMPMLVHVGARLVVNPGALLRDPADGGSGGVPTPGTFGLLDLPERTWRVVLARTGREVAFARRAL